LVSGLPDEAQERKEPMSKAVLISVDVAGRGKVEVVDWQDKPGLSEHYAAIECDLVQIAGVGKFGGVPVVMFVDEEGLLRNEVLLNLTACDFLAEATKSAPAYLMGGGLVGRALVLFDEGSDSRGFTEAEMAKVGAQLSKGGYPVAH